MIEPEETDTELRERLMREKEGRNVQHYNVLATAWVNTLMEHDKTLITLASGAIGLLITILTTKGVEKGWLIPIYFIAFSAFVTAIISSVRILKDNSKIIENEIREAIGEDPIHTPKLKQFDVVAQTSFVIGTITFVLIGILTAVSKLYGPSPKPEVKPPVKTEQAPPQVPVKPQTTRKAGHHSNNRVANPPEYRVIYLNCIQSNTTSSRNGQEVK
jgi:hypothetical protein